MTHSVQPKKKTFGFGFGFAGNKIEQNTRGKDQRIRRGLLRLTKSERVTHLE